MLSTYTYISSTLELVKQLYFSARPGQARPKINILQNLYNGLNIGGGQKLMKILLSTGIICDLISVQSQTVGSSKQNIIFRIVGNLTKFLKN